MNLRGSVLSEKYGKLELVMTLTYDDVRDTLFIFTDGYLKAPVS